MRDLISSLVLLSLAACGGSGGGSVPANSGPNPPPKDADPGGLWSGTLTYEDQTFEELLGITTPAGRFVLISLDTFGPGTVAQHTGMVTVAGSDVAGTGFAYPEPGNTWPNGAAILDLNISGVLDERASFSGTITTGDGVTRSFELLYDAEYERNSSLSLTEGVWYVYDDVLNPVFVGNVAADGAFSGQNVMGCSSAGQISIIDAEFNTYGWDVTITNCPIAGDYSGFAVMGDIDTGDPDNSQNNALLVTISNDQRALLLPLQR